MEKGKYDLPCGTDGALNKELHVVGSHIKNIGRILAGKEVKTVGEQIPDRGLIHKITKRNGIWQDCWFAACFFLFLYIR